jgi:hypothetical protein
MTKTITSLAIISDLEPGIHKFWCEIISNPLSQAVKVPVMIAKGPMEGKTFGATAAIHGNEVNGIPIIQNLFKNINYESVQGAIVGIPVANIPSFERKKRRYVDGRDLNHHFPGKPDGHNSSVYAYNLFQRCIMHFDYLVDLHTASFGRINSYYIRADLSDPITKKMALLQNAQIIVHNPPNDSTLRGAASHNKIHAITLEVGNPNIFQKGIIRSGLTGLFNVLHEFNIYPDQIEAPENEAVLCKDSYWLYVQEGGVLQVLPNLAQHIQKGEVVAIVKDIFGEIVKRYTAPEDGIVIGKSNSPVNISGGRILHLGRKY